MRALPPFELEDFFLTFEHRPGLLNLASSDVAPWTLDELPENIRNGLRTLNFGYPDVQSELLPSIANFCRVASSDQVLATSGAGEGVALALLSRVNEHPIHVAIPHPSYGSYNGLCDLLCFQKRRYTYSQSDNWTLDDGELLECVSTCDVTIVNSPHNPTGHCLPQNTLDRMLDIASQVGSTIIFDEVFRIASEPRFADHPNVIFIGSLTKLYGFPGLRLGWVQAEKSEIQRMRTIQQLTTVSLNALAALIGPSVFNDPLTFCRSDILRTNRASLHAWQAASKGLVTLSAFEGGTTALVTFNVEASEEHLFLAFVEAGVLLVPAERCFNVQNAVPCFRLGYGFESTRFTEALSDLSRVAAQFT